MSARCQHLAAHARPWSTINGHTLDLATCASCGAHLRRWRLASDASDREPWAEEESPRAHPTAEVARDSA